MINKATGIFLLVGLGYSCAYSQQNTLRPTSVYYFGLNKQAPDRTNTSARETLLIKRILLPQNSAEWVLMLGSGGIVMSLWLAEQQFRFIHWNKESWSSKNGAVISKYDKLEHFGIAATGHALLIGFNESGIICSSAFDRIKLSMFAMALWEVKDAVAPWERYGEWGGEGFSMKDWTAGAAGIVGTELLNLAFKKLF